MAEVKWIKLSTDLFNNRKIKQIRKLPEGDAIIGIWLQIMCLAGEINNGGLVYFSKDIPYTDEMLAVEFERPINIIRLALRTFEKFGMIEIVENVICVSNWEKYQSQDKLEAIREYNRVKKRESRARQKERMSLTCQGSQDTDNISISNSISNSNNLIEEKKVRHKYGQYKNVLLDDEQMEKLQSEFSDYEERIERLSEYMASTGKSYKNHLATIRNWARRDAKSGNPFKEALRKEIENEQKRSNSVNDGYQGGLSKLLQEPSRD